MRSLCDRLKVVHGEDPLSCHSNAQATKLMRSLVRASLSAKSVTQEHRLSSEAFDWLLGQIEHRFQQAQVRTFLVSELQCVSAGREEWAFGCGS